jgi:hypothetical protein
MIFCVIYSFGHLSSDDIYTEEFFLLINSFVTFRISIIIRVVLKSSCPPCETEQQQASRWKEAREITIKLIYIHVLRYLVVG